VRNPQEFAFYRSISFWRCVKKISIGLFIIFLKSQTKYHQKYHWLFLISNTKQNKYFHIFAIAYCLIKFDLLMTQLLIFCRGAASKEKAMDGDKERVLPGDSQILSGKLLAGWVVSGRNG